MPSLRELLQNVKERDKAISQSAYALLQALVKRWEAQEVEKHMASLAYVHTELAEAKVEVVKLRKHKAWWEQALESLKATEQKRHGEMSELRAEIAELTAQHIEDEKHIVKLREQCKNAWQKLAEVATDAEIGRLVRGMRAGTRLVRGLGGYGPKETHPCAWFPGWYDDPAEALRAIQEVGDARDISDC